MLDILRQNLENMNEIYKHTDNMYKAGTVEVTDVDQIRINVGQLKNSLLSMERTVAVNYNLYASNWDWKQEPRSNYGRSERILGKRQIRSFICWEIRH